MKSKSNIKNNTYAKRKIKRLKKFYINLAIFLTIGTAMIVASLFKDADSVQLVPNWVAPVAMFIWACLLIIQALHTFDNKFVYDKSWEEKKIRKYMDEGEEQTWV